MGRSGPHGLRAAEGAARLRPCEASDERMAYESMPARWLEGVADVLDEVGGPEFAPRLLDVLRRSLPSERAVFYVLRRSHRPWLLYDEQGSAAEVIERGHAYFGGGYLLDPYYRAFLEGRPAGLYTYSDLRSDPHEEDPRGWSGAQHVTYLAPVSKEACLVLLILRGDDPPAYDEAAIAAYRALERVVCAAMGIHWKLWAEAAVGPGDDPGELYVRVERALSRFGADLLTPREAEVIRLLLRGHSARAAATRLGIAPATAALHRKRAYAKLGVCSQAELFYLFIRSLSTEPPMHDLPRP